MKAKIWTIEEDEYIRNNFGKISFRKMAEKLNCVRSTVQNRAIVLGLPVEKKVIKIPIWTEEKINFLKENLNKLSLSQIMKELDVNYNQIMNKIRELDLVYDNKRWSEEEERILIELSTKCYIREIAKVLNRTEDTILVKAQNMGLDYISLKRKYTTEELDYIKNNWGKIPVTEIARHLKVSRKMVETQANLMELPKLGKNPYIKWTPEKIAKLRKMAVDTTITELAKIFKVTKEAIKYVAYSNDIELINEQIFSETENELLREYAKTMSVAEIATKMDRGISTIYRHVKEQNIPIKRTEESQASLWTEENDKQLIDLVSKDKTLLEIVKIMNKKDHTIVKKAKKLGLEIKKEKRREWTEEEKKKLIELSKTKKISELVIELERTTSAIELEAKKLGITLIRDKNNWTKEECQQLEKLIMEGEKTSRQIAIEMNRTEQSIIHKISRLGLELQIRERRTWTEEEETTLMDLWGIKSPEKIAQKLNRTIDAVKNRASRLGLGSQIENNYDGLKIQDICDLFNVRRELVTSIWVALGLKCKKRYISSVTSYQYVEIEDLYEFLEKNQNIWDSRTLERNILGMEPEWLQEKRKKDMANPIGELKIESLTKQQLIASRNFFLDTEQQLDDCEFQKNNHMKLVKKKKQNNNKR